MDEVPRVRPSILCAGRVFGDFRLSSSSFVALRIGIAADVVGAAVKIHNVTHGMLAPRIAAIIGSLQEVKRHGQAFRIMHNAAHIIAALRCAGFQTDEMPFPQPWNVRRVDGYFLNDLAVLIKNGLCRRFSIGQLFV